MAAIPASRSASTNSAITVAPQVQAEPSSVGIECGPVGLACFSGSGCDPALDDSGINFPLFRVAGQAGLRSLFSKPLLSCRPYG